MSSLLEQMKQPGFYPHPVKTPIELMQTHVSYVFLTGDYAYKVKKPVNFGFLDFSTLERRQHFCQEELRLNQPYAPEIYLEVLPITQTDSKLVLAGEGEPVEYALKMSQFPQDTLLVNLFEQSQLTEAHMEELGRVVAQFHAQAPSNDYIRSFGTVDKVREALDENYKQTNKYIGSVQTQQQYEETQEFSDRFFKQRQELLSARREKGAIRECHGDLHLRNICLWHDKIQLFDRIEFNEPFRFVDVMYDVAFAVMDLDARGCKNLGNAFLNTYVEQTGDWEGLQVLPLYLSRQAYVRAKVTSFLLDDPEVPEDAKQEAAATAADYYRLAWEYTKTNQGRLMIMSGLSGSGKSTVARRLARHLGAIHLRSDAVRKHLAGISLDQQGGDEIYTPEMNQRTYDRLLELGIMLASQGFAVILDAKYDRQALRKEAIAQAQAHQLPLQILHCIAPVEVLCDRLSSRTGDVSDATANLLEKQRATAEAFTEAEQSLVTSLDTTQDWASQLGLKS
ncbi:MULTISPECIES: AAA family ATPase [unclassified Coleofasciculus]|uniref:bifunctional aminoglycoside phosphotransferase/ATP-binding protein n=1 Tax=unclassified Coleofasciculus TaxID=2692782 RepID=UPI0018803E75|nr:MULTISPECIES: AAA family ATPase [unclassified Coleofasciculus]MBE9126190.1 AAA family ATPase [Coleofasciculus sp. LEGE 07081]MBE9149603.1 AAA family ATPase [Coleofasciculus sp. LEGE 07092]